MRIWSNDFQNEGAIPKLFTCDDRDVSPHLAWDGVPEGTQSLALIVDDPDCPGTWAHWLVCDIPPHVGEMPRGAVPTGSRQVRNDFGKVDYGGPCPPSGTHRYFHRLYALRTPRMEATDKRSFYAEVERSKLAEAVLMGRYKRSRW